MDSRSSTPSPSPKAPRAGFTLCPTCDGRATVVEVHVMYDARFDDGPCRSVFLPAMTHRHRDRERLLVCPACDGSGLTVSAAGADKILARNRRERAAQQAIEASTSWEAT